jgi:hypothetical protein
VNIDLGLEGVEAAIEELEDLEDDVETITTYTVGTAVQYSLYLEFGTSKMDARPFFRPAINEVRAQGVDGFIAHNTRTSVDALNDIDSVLRVLALALERRIKEIITQKSLIDTGTLRASIVAIRGGDPTGLPAESDFAGFDSDSQAPATAGRAAADETVDINL